jgi:hypothetical protein
VTAPEAILHPVVLSSSSLNLQEAADPEADLDYIVCSLDALSGVAEALGFRFEALLTASAPASAALRDALLQCCQVRGGNIVRTLLSCLCAAERAKCCGPHLDTRPNAVKKLRSSG